MGGLDCGGTGETKKMMVREILPFVGKLVKVAWTDAKQHNDCDMQDNPLCPSVCYGLLKQVSRETDLPCVILFWGEADGRTDCICIPTDLITEITT